MFAKIVLSYGYSNSFHETHFSFYTEGIKQQLHVNHLKYILRKFFTVTRLCIDFSFKTINLVPIWDKRYIMFFVKKLCNTYLHL